MRDFANKIVVISGAGSGIGRALALELARRGAVLAVSDIDTAAVAETATRCARLGALARPDTVDVSDRAAVYAYAEHVRDTLGEANLLVNNAGVSHADDITDLDFADFHWVMDIDFWGVVHGTKAFLPSLIASGDGHIVNISSVLGLLGVPSQSPYVSAKFAVRGFTEALRQEMIIGGLPVGVTCVHPGGVRTNITTHSRDDRYSAHERAELARRFQRFALTTPEGAARAIVHGVLRNRPRVLIGPEARALDLIPRLAGPGYGDILARITRLGRRIRPIGSDHL
ncbi:SDR family NAD(P)-dependent oxidoreductase [Nocardia testacea]|uniref:SDR family NAD(P)-dependent oxidoreductase n=1 Tax=Nocardia testacea TaxID=248551 RepID=UPI003C2B9ABE